MERDRETDASAKKSGASPLEEPRHEDESARKNGRPHRRWKIRVVRIDARKYPQFAEDKLLPRLDRQKEDGSLDTQLDRLTSLVEYRRKQGDNWSASEKLVEGEKDGKRHGKSAKNTDRPACQKLLELARAHLIDVVAVTKLDRISRSLSDFVKLIEELERYGVKLISLKEQIDFTSPAGRLQTYILIALAQYERELTSSRVRDKVLWRAEKGLPIGPPPSGSSRSSRGSSTTSCGTRARRAKVRSNCRSSRSQSRCHRT